MRSSIDKISVKNPYDFSNPVRRLEDLAGREKELDNIKSCLKGEKMSIAIIGRRGIGKTSFLNAVNDFVQQSGKISILIKLDGEIIKDEFIFFREIYTGLMEILFKLKKISDVEYQDYRSMIDGIKVDSKPYFLKFPRSFYSNFINNIKIPITRSYLNDDFKSLHERAGTQLVILLDECDFFANNKELLQCLRNILQSVNGYTFILAGTEKMFPNMNDVFSPVTRQFKRIDIEGFKTYSQTLDLISKPLIASNIELPDIIDREIIEDLHKIAEGNPYELKVLCHYLWEYSKDKFDLKLNHRIFAEVANEIQILNPSHSKFISKIETYSNSDLEQLVILVQNDNFTLKEKAMLQLSFTDKYNVDNIQELEKHYKESINNYIDIVRLSDENKVIFQGENFEKLYLKYIALSRFKDKMEGKRWNNLPFHFAFFDKFIMDVLSPFILKYNIGDFYILYKLNDIDDPLNYIFNHKFNKIYRYFENDKNPLPNDYIDMVDFFKSYIYFEGKPEYNLVIFKSDVNGSVNTGIILLNKNKSIKDLELEINKYSKQFVDINFKITYSNSSFPELSMDKLFSLLNKLYFRNKKDYDKLSKILQTAAVKLFFRKQYNKSKYIFEQLITLDSNNFENNNDLGFTCLKLKEDNIAEKYLTIAHNLCNIQDLNNYFLITLNQAALAIFKKDYTNAIKILKTLKNKYYDKSTAILYNFIIGLDISNRPYDRDVNPNVIYMLMMAYAEYFLDKTKTKKVEDILLSGYKKYNNDRLYLNGLINFYKEIQDSEKYNKYNYRLNQL